MMKMEEMKNADPKERQGYYLVADNHPEAVPMAKFAIACPACGEYIEGKTGFFAEK